MRRISSRYTFYVKRLFPLIWAAALLFIVVDQLVRGSSSGEWPLLIVVVLMIPFGYFVMRLLGLFEIADVVFDAGDALIVRNRGREARIALSEIAEISSSSSLGKLPWRAMLSLRTPSIFGSRVSFMLPLRLLPFRTSPIVKELMDR